jgi:hypothetical protein
MGRDYGTRRRSGAAQMQQMEHKKNTGTSLKQKGAAAGNRHRQAAPGNPD